MAASSTSNQAKAALAGNNLLIVLALVTLVVIGITGFVGNSLVRTILRNNKVVAAKATADTNIQADVAAAPNLVASYQSMGTAADILANALPLTADFPSTLVTMENIANKNGLLLKGVNPEPITGTSGTPVTASTDDGKPQTTQYAIVVVGTYDHVKAMFADLELSARPLRVVGAQFNGSGSALTTQLDIQTYYQSAAKLPIGSETIQ